MPQDSIITLVMVSDNNLVIMLAALLRSIEDNHHGNERIQIYIVNDRISRRNIRRIDSVIGNDKISIIWKNITDVIPKDCQVPLDNSTFPLNTYVRLFLFHFLPLDVEKAIYMDVDMIVLNDISNLWQIDLQSYPLAAVTDKIEVVSDPDHGIRNYESLGLNSNAKYFNSGLMIFNLEHWRDGRYAREVIEIIDENKRFAKYPDQYGLNVAFANNWLELSTKWNHFANRKIDNLPYLIHFISTKPLYEGYSFDKECKNIFYSYLHATPWRRYKPKKDLYWKFHQFRYKLTKLSRKQIFIKILRRIKLRDRQIPINRY